MATKHFCSSCRRGENKVPAIGLFRGFKVSRDGAKRTPWSGYLCADHADAIGALTDDLEQLRLVRKVG